MFIKIKCNFLFDYRTELWSQQCIVSQGLSQQATTFSFPIHPHSLWAWLAATCTYCSNPSLLSTLSYTWMWQLRMDWWSEYHSLICSKSSSLHPPGYSFRLCAMQLKDLSVLTLVPLAKVEYVEPAKFTTWNFCKFEVPGIFTFWEPTQSGDYASLFCLMIACVVAKLWSMICSVERSFIHSRQKSIESTHTCILWGVITRSVINSVCSPLVIHTLKIYKTSLYFLPFLFKKQ